MLTIVEKKGFDFGIITIPELVPADLDVECGVRIHYKTVELGILLGFLSSCQIFQ